MLRLLLLLLVLPLASAAQQPFAKLPYFIDTPDESELLPVVSADGKTLYLARTRQGLDSTLVFDIWSSAITNDTSYAPPEFVGGTLASRNGIAVTSVAPDNNTLYVIGKLRDDAPPEERVSVTHRTASDWSIPEPLHIRGLRARGVYTDYSFGPDGRTLLMAVERDSSLGDRDLYVSFVNSAGTWSTPLWLGPIVNSAYTELTPFLAADNKTLYFSSNRPGGIGEIDVYRSLRLDDSWQNWSRPENLGPGVNRPGRTSFYTENARGTWAYLSWKRSAGEQSDIFRVKVQHASALALLHGTVTDAKGKPLLARVYYDRLSDGKELGSARSDPATGAYQISLPAGEEYSVHADRSGYFPTSEHLDLRSLTVFQSIEKDLVLSKIEAGVAVTLKNVFFETDKATLLPASYPELDRVADLLTSHEDYKLQVWGHTDSLGSAQHNLALSKSRAEAVRDYLIGKKIAAPRVEIVPMGATKPIASNETEEGRSRNRRVEFILLAKDAR